MLHPTFTPSLKLVILAFLISTLACPTLQFTRPEAAQTSPPTLSSPYPKDSPSNSFDFYDTFLRCDCPKASPDIVPWEYDRDCCIPLRRSIWTIFCLIFGVFVGKFFYDLHKINKKENKD